MAEYLVPMFVHAAQLLSFPFCRSDSRDYSRYVLSFQRVHEPPLAPPPLRPRRCFLPFFSCCSEIDEERGMLLEIVAGPLKGERRRVRRDGATVGRATESTIRLVKFHRLRFCLSVFRDVDVKICSIA